MMNLSISMLSDTVDHHHDKKETVWHIPRASRPRNRPWKRYKGRNRLLIHIHFVQVPGKHHKCFKTL